MAPGQLRGSDRGSPHWVYCLESKKGSQRQGKDGSWEIEAYGGEDKTETTLEWGSGWRCYPFGGHWRILDCRI